MLRWKRQGVELAVGEGSLELCVCLARQETGLEFDGTGRDSDLHRVTCNVASPARCLWMPKECRGTGLGQLLAFLDTLGADLTQPALHAARLHRARHASRAP